MKKGLGEFPEKASLANTSSRPSRLAATAGNDLQPEKSQFPIHLKPGLVKP
ncbi:MAG TPA: hypothetical protein VLZ03_15970 [Thermodesulfobacteriota bacterium]|nr:hypothetical protein [Thermodesulfobacteriota bacterium]